MRTNDRSDAALHERLKIAGKATPGSWSLQDRGAIPLVYGPNGERIAKAIDNREDTAHIAASSLDVVRADIEEILRLRAENERLNKEADWLVEMLSHYTEDCPLKFKVVYEVWFPIPRIDQCSGQESDIEDCAYIPSQCWREAARKAVEGERNG